MNFAGAETTRARVLVHQLSKTPVHGVDIRVSLVVEMDLRIVLPQRLVIADHIYTQCRSQVIQTLLNASQITSPVTGRVLKTTRVDLVENTCFPPFISLHGIDSQCPAQRFARDRTLLELDGQDSESSGLRVPFLTRFEVDDGIVAEDTAAHFPGLNRATEQDGLG